MSHSNRHQFAKLEKNSKPLTGQRLARVIAKAAKEALGADWVKKENGFYNPNLVESLVVSVPMIDSGEVVANIDALAPHITAMLESAQDSIIGEKRKESGCSEVADEEISVAACIAYLDAVAKGNRVTGEYLVEWFKETYSLQAAQFIALMCKFPENEASWTPDQVQVIEQKSNVLAGMFSGFASGKYSPEIPKCKAIEKFGEWLGDGADSRMLNYVQKAKQVREQKEKELSADALGF
jgi:hypothetical protein